MIEEQLAFALRDEEELSVDLIEAQYALKNSKDKNNAKSLVILVSGIELAGKGEAVKQLREWVDPRYLRVKADPASLFSSKQSFGSLMHGTFHQKGKFSCFLAIGTVTYCLQRCMFLNP